MSSRHNKIRLALFGLVALSTPLAAALATGGAEATRDALERPAVATVSPQGAVMLGAALAGSRIVAVGERGLAILSDDGGASWRQARTPVSVTLTAVRFADAERGIAVGHGGVVLATADAGESWSLRLDGRRAAQLALEAAEAAHNAELAASAQVLVEEGPDKPFLDVLLPGKDEVVVVGAYGLAFASSDFGHSWTSLMGRLDNPEGLHLNAARMRGERIVIAGERGLALYSTDAGKSFVRLQTPYDGSFFTAELPSDHDIVLAGLRGNLVQSSDGGQTWTTQQSPVGASLTASTLLGDGSVLLVSQAGQVLKWSAAAPLAPLAGNGLPALNGIARAQGDRLLLLSNLGVSALDLKALTKEGSK